MLEILNSNFLSSGGLLTFNPLKVLKDYRKRAGEMKPNPE
jgi:hypothetical protein